MQAVTKSVSLSDGPLKRMAHRVSRRKNTFGFTLIEISIVLVIVGLILGGILNARSVIRNAQTQDLIRSLNDMAAATHQFGERFGLWPGDYSNAVAAFPGLVAPCAGVNGNGNGQVGTAAEAICATQHLILAGMIKGTVGAAPLNVRGVGLSVTGATAGLTGLPAASIPANWVNVILVSGLFDCDIAVQMDRATDDGNTNTGNFRTAINNCGATGADQSEAIAVTRAILRLN